MQSRAGVKNVTAIRDARPTIVRDNAHRVSTSYPQVFGLSVSTTGKVVARTSSPLTRVRQPSHSAARAACVALPWRRSSSHL